MINKIELQLFAQEKTEKATPKKKQESRKKGQVARSQEVNSALVLLGTFFGLNLLMPYMITEVQNYTRYIFSELHHTELTTNQAYQMFLELLLLSFKIVLPIMAIALILGLFASYSQVGFLFTTEPLKIKPEKLSPIKGFKRIFSKRSLVELFKSILKISAISLITYFTIYSNADVFPLLLDMEIIAILHFLGYIIFTISWRVGLFMLVLAAIDLVYQKWEHEQSIKMSKQDVKDEHKQTEGNPQIKSKVKEKQR